MSTKNALELKENIISIMKRRGPSLPVHVAKETGLSILFASAFLSELIADKRIKYTEMKVGSSPIYFLNEHAPMLEKFSQHLSSREKDAFNLLKEKRFLIDAEQTPVIRVALRAIKDFAIPFLKNGQTIWRYYLVPESEFSMAIKQEVKETLLEKEEEKPLIKLKLHIPKKEEKIEEKEMVKEEIKSDIIKLEEKEPRKEKIKKTRAKKTTKKKMPKHDENFFNKVKEWVLKNSMEILDIQSFNKNELHLKIRKDGKDHLLVAYNKKRVNDSDLVKAHKKAKEMGMEYAILSFGELQKKMGEIIDAAKNLTHINKID